MSPVAPGPWERRPQRTGRHAQPEESEQTIRTNPPTAPPPGPYLAGRPGSYVPNMPAVPFFPGQEDATLLIQRITDEAVPPGSFTSSAVEETIRLADRPLAPRRTWDRPGGGRTPDGRPVPTRVATDTPAVTELPAGQPPAADTGIGAEFAAAPDEQLRTARTSGVVRAGAMMAVATLASRITGFVAKALLLGVLGASIANDSYNLANTLPNIVFELVIGGVLTSVAIPLLSRARADPDGGAEYTQRLMTMALVGLVGVTALAVLAAPLFTRLYSSGGANANPELTTQLARLLLPQIFFYGMAALFGAILNTKERFAAPAWAPLVNNLVVIAMAVTLSLLPGGLSLTGLTPSQLLLLGLGTTAGIVVQALVMVPSLWRSGFRFRWRWGGDRRLTEAGGLMLWSIVYALISAAGYVISTRVFTGNKGGSLTAYSYASMLFQLPYGILGVSVLTAMMPRMSRHAAAGDIEAVKNDASLANRLSTIALMPVAVAMLALSATLGLVTSRFGNVSTEASRMIGGTLAGMALGLVPLAITLVQMRVFYAMKDARTPTLINAVMVAVRIPLILICGGLRDDLIAPGIAAATAVSYLIGALVGEIWLRARYGPMGTARLLLTVIKTALAAGVAGLAAWWVSGLLDDRTGRLGSAVIQLVAGAATGLIVLSIGLLLVRIPELDPVRRRLGRMLGFPARSRPEVAPSGTNHGPQFLVTDRQEFPAVASDTPDDLFGEDRSESDVVTPAEEATVVISPADPPSPADDAPEPAEQGGPAQPVGSAAAAPEQPADPAPALAPGATVGGRYRLVSQVAVDAAGNRFWRAKDTVLPRDMAVTLLPDSSGTSATVARTLRTGRLHHIGLPQTLDLGTDHGQTFVVGQWVDGATLTDLLARGPLEPPVATSIAGKISEAVAEAHRNGLALGSISPSLVRVNVDGQVRFSHVIAHAAATPDADIRSVGALLYLMLTGSWPVSEHIPAVAGTSLKSAPQRNGREAPADQVVDAVPPALSALTSRALHPEDSDGIHAVGALATLLREPDVVPAAAAGAAGHYGAPEPAPQPPPTMSPADRKLRKERRTKLGLAATFIAAFVALILILVATLAKNVLTDIDRSNVAGFDNAIDTSSKPQASATTVPPVKTTRGSTGSGTSSSPPTSASSSAAAPPAGQPVKVVDAQVFDPEGKGSKDYADLVDRLYDGDPETQWLTFVYKQQFRAKADGGYKVGVGVVLQFDHPVTPQSVEVTVPSSGIPDFAGASTSGMTVEIRTASGPLPATIADTQVIGSGQIVNGPAVITVQNAPQSQYLLVFLSQIPGSGTNFQAKIGEITVKGT